MRSILHPAPTASKPGPVSKPAPQPEQAPAAADGSLSLVMLPVIALVTGFSLFKLGVPLLAAVGIVAVATTIGLVRRFNSAS